MVTPPNSPEFFCFTPSLSPSPQPKPPFSLSLFCLAPFSTPQSELNQIRSFSCLSTPHLQLAPMASQQTQNKIQTSDFSSTGTSSLSPLLSVSLTRSLACLLSVPSLQIMSLSSLGPLHLYCSLFQLSFNSAAASCLSGLTQLSGNLLRKTSPGH